MHTNWLDTLPLTRSFSRSASALTIAGSDPSGGAGLQADLKTFQQLGVYGTTAITLITVQNTQCVDRVEWLPIGLIKEQIRAVLQDIPPSAIKIGAIGKRDVAEAVASELFELATPIVVDPVLVSKHGHSLADDEAVSAIRRNLLPRSAWVTPNRFEAARLTGRTVSNVLEAEDAAQALHALGAENVLLKFGKHEGQSLHILISEGRSTRILTERVASKGVHGSGCVLAATLTAGIALGVTDPLSLAQFAIQRVVQTIKYQTAFGQGNHPAETRAISN